METGIEEWRQENPRDSSQLQNTLFYYSLGLGCILTGDNPAAKELRYNFVLLACSFLGFNVNFLFNSFNTIDLCQNVGILAKVIQSITLSLDSVFATMILGF